MRNAEAARQMFHRQRFAFGLRPKPVIDRDCGKFWRMLPPLLKSAGPMGGQDKQRRGVGPTGDGENKSAQIFKTTK